MNGVEIDKCLDRDNIDYELWVQITPKTSAFVEKILWQRSRYLYKIGLPLPEMKFFRLRVRGVSPINEINHRFGDSIFAGLSAYVGVMTS